MLYSHERLHLGEHNIYFDLCICFVLCVYFSVFVCAPVPVYVWVSLLVYVHVCPHLISNKHKFLFAFLCVFIPYIKCKPIKLTTVIVGLLDASDSKPQGFKSTKNLFLTTITSKPHTIVSRGPWARGDNRGRSRDQTGRGYHPLPWWINVDGRQSGGKWTGGTISKTCPLLVIISLLFRVGDGQGELIWPRMWQAGQVAGNDQGATIGKTCLLLVPVIIPLLFRVALGRAGGVNLGKVAGNDQGQQLVV